VSAQIKQSFLNSLEGLFTDQAEALVDSEGLIYYGVQHGVVISRILRPDTIICWLDEQNVVRTAEAGNIGQVVDDA
jgi:hypothetical protein